MEQISLPMRIALAATLVFAALWLVVLRPKPVDDTAGAALPTATTSATKKKSTKAATSVTSAAEKATKAVGTANKTTTARTKAADDVGEATAAATGSATTTPQTSGTTAQGSTTTSTATTTAKAQLPGSKAVLADVAAGRTVVLLFWSMNSSTDDRAVKLAVDDVDRHGGKVRVHTARMSKLPDYEAITKATPVTTSPTILVIDRRSKARSITGLTTTREIDAVVDRALKVK